MNRRGVWGLLLAAWVSIAAWAADGVGGGDPVWGAYPQLVGKSGAAAGGYRLRWYWIVPGRELAQEYRNPGDDSLAHRDVITPGATPGTLVLDSSYLGRKQWNGRIQPDGSVLYVGKGLLKLPYVAGFGDAGAWEIRQVKLDDGRIASVDPVTQYNRFVLSEEAAATGAGMTAATPPAPTAVPPPATVTATGTGTGTGTVAPARLAAGPKAAPARVPRALPVAAAAEPVGAPAAAAAAPEPASTPAPAPVPAALPDFGVMTRFIGQRFVYRDALGAVYTIDGGRTLVMQFGSHTYHLQATDRPDRFEVPVHPLGHGASGRLLDDGRLEVRYTTRGMDDLVGTSHRVRFGRGDDGGVLLTAEWHGKAAILAGWEDAWSQTYRPYSERAATEERQLAKMDAATNARIARERAIERAESNAAMERAFSGMMGNLSDFAAREQQQAAQAQAVVDRINAQARAEAEARRQADALAARQQAEQRRAQQDSVARQLADQARAREASGRQPTTSSAPRTASTQPAAPRTATPASPANPSPPRSATPASPANPSPPRSATPASPANTARPRTPLPASPTPAAPKMCQYPASKTTVFDQKQDIEARIARACGRASPTVTRRDCDKFGWCKVWIDCSTWEDRCPAAGSAQ